MDYSGVLLGWFLGIVSLAVAEVIGYYFARKNLESQPEHSLRIAKMQLFHEDRKKALIELDELLKAGYKTFDDFRNAVITFLDGKQGLFLPRKLTIELRGEVLKLDSLCLLDLLSLDITKNRLMKITKRIPKLGLKPFPRKLLMLRSESV